MYKIKPEFKGFKKPVRLAWLEDITDSNHSYCPANGYHGVSGGHKFTYKAFGSLSYAVGWLNSEENEVEPGFVAVNDVHTPLTRWFDTV